MQDKYAGKIDDYGKDDKIFRDVYCERFDENASIEEYKRDIVRYLMVCSWHYSEYEARKLVKFEESYIQESYKKSVPVADVAINIGYGCG